MNVPVQAKDRGSGRLTLLIRSVCATAPAALAVPGEGHRDLERRRELSQFPGADRQARRQRRQLGVTIQHNGNRTWPTVSCSTG